jgi:CRISPR-associated exonuclease Cas4
MTRIRAWKLSGSGTGHAGFRTSLAKVKMREPLALSLLNDFLYCNRRAALKVVEGWRSANQHTARGNIVHEHADLRGYEVVQGVKILRALPVFSDRLRLNGKCDIVEQRPDGSVFPVEFKVGKRRQWQNDDAQLCAQALCLEEMFHTTIPGGAIFHADSKRRREIEFSSTLRTLTEKTIADLHALLDSTVIPRAEFREACEECSLYKICLPRVTSQPTLLHHAAERLFET